jgi:hypothetical protein
MPSPSDPCIDFLNALFTEEKARKVAKLSGATRDEIETLVAQEIAETEKARMAWRAEQDAKEDYGEEEKYLFPCG